MNSEEQEIQKIKSARSLFHTQMQILRERKKQLFSLFRSKLEEKKIEEIKDGLSK
jgi:hypothetical protein